jgi:hypothetical protein
METVCTAAFAELATARGAFFAWLAARRLDVRARHGAQRVAIRRRVTEDLRRLFYVVASVGTTCRRSVAPRRERTCPA